MTSTVQKTGQSPATRVLITVASSVVIIAGMRAAQSIIVPFLLSAFIAVICAVPLLWLKRKGISTGIAVIVVLFGILLIGLIIGVLIGTSVQDFSSSLPAYQARLQGEIAQIFNWLRDKGININEKGLLKLINPGTAMQVFAGTLDSFRKVLTNGFMIILTVIFILLEVSGFPDKLRAALGNRGSSSAGLDKIALGIKRYIAIKTVTSLATGVFVSVCLVIIGVDYPALWGLVAFLLNYVPSIGSIIAAVPAVILSFIQFGIGRTLFVIGAYLLVNTIIGSIIEPRVMGRGMGLSTLVVFLSLVFWGWVLGPIGMLLSVPLTMIVKISLEESEDTRWIAVLLG
jgi:predicted PurR-regulated permease PerM